MASEAVKKILSAEADSNRKNSDARKRSEDILVEAERYSALAIQKKISTASAESEKIRSEYRKKSDIHAQKVKAYCIKQIENIRIQARQNMDNAVNAAIKRFF